MRKSRTVWDFTDTWLDTLSIIIDAGSAVAPRGQPTLEILQHTVAVDMRRPVLMSPSRKLSYAFMAAEAFWILSGSDRVEHIAPYNANIAKFSDDGEVFFGAYGPKIVAQLDYVVDKLIADNDSRQAGLTIWRENPPQSKDIPCTVAIFFSLRHDVVNAHVFMRSSDVWLGLPYDVFNFSMLAHQVCCRLYNAGVEVAPGNLYLTAASSHLYERDLDSAKECLSKGVAAPIQNQTPQALYTGEPELFKTLEVLRGGYAAKHARWWE